MKKTRQKNSLLLRALLQLPKTTIAMMMNFITKISMTRRRRKKMASSLKKTKKRRKTPSRRTVVTTRMTGKWKMSTGAKRTAMANKKSSRQKMFLKMNLKRRSLSQLLNPCKESTGNIRSKRQSKILQEPLHKLPLEKQRQTLRLLLLLQLHLKPNLKLTLRWKMNPPQPYSRVVKNQAVPEIQVLLVTRENE